MYRFIGKFIGFILGMGLASWTGAIIGFVIGHLHDKNVEKRLGNLYHTDKDNYFPDYILDPQYKTPFAMSIIVLGAKLAKCDGVVTENEILAFRQAFRANPEYESEIGNLFNQARSSAEGYEPHAARLASILNMQHDVLEIILANLFFIAKADSTHLSHQEIHFLRQVAILFGFSETDFIKAASKVGVHLETIPPEPKKETIYDTLGLPASATDDVIKRTYRSLIQKYHPDKLQASGLPASKVEEASEKVKKINAAYTEICKQRKMK